ncbi:MAG: acyl--CoA ligase [Clostridiales bacterium]|nr:acyl--CoA ligase [Clostridiales bacterium]
MKYNTIDMTPVVRPYPETTMFGAVAQSAERFPDAPAFDFMGKITNYKTMLKKTELAAGAFYRAGIRKGDVVTICMPNTPQGVICLYALNRIGAVANMVHPLSSKTNITFYLDYSESKMILTLDQFYEKVRDAAADAKKNVRLIIARISEELNPVLAVGYSLTGGKDYLKFPEKDRAVVWNDFLKTGKNVKLPPIEYDKNRTAVILYSGGTSGSPKGICLSDFNFNALGMQIGDICGCNVAPGCKFLSVMPIFHGFGLGIGIHTILENGAECILVPQFTKESYAKTVLKKKPNFIAGVPTLYEGLLKVDIFKDADLSFLIGVFSGGDSLSPELKKRADAFFKEHNAPVQIREGYGLTECVTASCVTPVDESKEGGIGLPLRDTKYKIVEPGTFNELPLGQAGEIIISGPTLMLGYLKNEEANEKTIRLDENGSRWLFTGDMGYMDSDGFVFFTQRIKRMIISSGYNIYPSQIEKVLDKHPDIDYSCAIGVKDPYKMQRVRAYIVLNDGVPETDEEKDKIFAYCKEYLDVFARPKEIVFRKELPRTLVGKVAYHSLEEEAAAEEAGK